jgi:hypothetical protein
MPGSVQPAYTVFIALAGGQAPVLWQRDLGRATARLEALRRASAWLTTLAAVRPRLQDDPLLGRRLAELTNRVAQPTGSRPETDRIRRPRPAWSERPPARGPSIPPEDKASPAPSQSGIPKASAATARQSSQAPGEQPSRRWALPPLRLEAQASRAFLGPLAGEAASATGPDRFRDRQTRGLPQPRTRVSPPVAHDRAAQRNWLRGLARRVERSLLQNGPYLHLRSQPASPEQPELARGPSLTDPWAAPLGGQPASADLLARLAGTSVSDSYGSGRTAQPQQASHRPSLRRSTERPFAAAAGETQPWSRTGLAPSDDLVQWPGASVPVGDSHGFGRADQPQAASQQPSFSRSVQQSIAAAAGATPTEDTPGDVLATEASAKKRDGGGFAPPAGIAPPRMGASLPPLLAPQSVHEPPPTIATDAIRRGGRQEAAMAEDDLSMLAAKIKRILEEEARRYGIDV